MDKIMDFASRKFILVAGILVLAGTAMILKIVSWADFDNIAKWLVGLYLGANVIDRAVDKLPGNNSTKEPEK